MVNETIEVIQELAMQFSHFNNVSLALTYLANLPWPYDIELFFTKFGRWSARFWKVNLHYSKFSNLVTKFCENKFKVIRSH